MSLSFGAATTDRVDLDAGLDNITAFTVLMWVYPTTRTDGRRFYRKGNITLYWTFSPEVGIEFEVPRATTNANAITSDSWTLNKWWFVAVTYSEGDGPRCFRGDLITAPNELTYVSRTVGVGATSADSGSGMVIGNIGTVAPNAFEGRIGLFARFRRVMTVAELARYQWRPYADADCDALIRLGWNGTGSQINWSALGAGIDGTVVGAIQAPGVPLPPAFGASDVLSRRIPTAITVAVGQALETDTANVIAPVDQVAVAQALETDTANAITPARIVAVGQAVETDTATLFTSARVIPVASAAQTEDKAWDGTSEPGLPPMYPNYTDTIGIKAVHSVPLAQAIETDTANGAVPAHAVAVGQSLETDTANPITPPGTLTVPVGQAIEADTGDVIAPVDQVAVGQSLETDTGAVVSPGRAFAVSQATETDTAGVITPVKAVVVGQAVETDTATTFGIIGGASSGGEAGHHRRRRHWGVDRTVDMP